MSKKTLLTLSETSLSHSSYELLFRILIRVTKITLMIDKSLRVGKSISRTAKNEQ